MFNHRPRRRANINPALYRVRWETINLETSPSTTRRSSNIGTMLAHRLRRWPNIVPTLDERRVFAGIIWQNMLYNSPGGAYLHFRGAFDHTALGGTTPVIITTPEKLLDVSKWSG